jgi:hypothetical protein
MRRVDIQLGPFGTNVVNSVRVNGSDVHCRSLKVEASHDEYTTVTLELVDTEVNLSLIEPEVRGVRHAPSYFEHNRSYA